jgi:hypothetical protein
MMDARSHPIVALIAVALVVFGLFTFLRFMITYVFEGVPMSQPESRLSREIMNHIRARGGFCFKVHGGPLTMAGVPDVCGVYRGYPIWIETKTPEGEPPSPIQLVRHRAIEAAGGHVRVARSVEDARVWLDTFSEPRAHPGHTIPPTDTD